MQHDTTESDNPEPNRFRALVTTGPSHKITNRLGSNDPAKFSLVELRSLSSTPRLTKSGIVPRWQDEPTDA